MKKNKLLLFTVLMISLGMAYMACRKTDRQPESPGREEIEEKFFGSRPPGSSLIQTTIDYLRRQNDRLHFVEKTVKQIGMPYWDKAIVIKIASPNIPGGKDSTDVVYIPFVRETQNFVNASMIVNLMPGDSSFNYMCDWQYKNYAHGLFEDSKITAEGIALTIMTLDKKVFGHRSYTLLDNTLFSAYLPDSLKGIQSHLEILDSAEKNINSRSNVYAAPVPVILSCPICVSSYWQAVFYYNLNGMPGFGNIINENPSSCEMNCGPGWAASGGGASPPPPSEPIDSLLKKAAQLVNKYRDSLSALCETDTVERFFNIVLYNNQYDTFRVVKSKSSEEVNPNYYMNQGRILKAEWHYHPKYPDGTSGSWPSGGDITKLYDKHNGHIMIVDTYDARYALVVEDENKMTTWKNIFGNGPNILPKKIYDSVDSDPRASSPGSIYVNMTKEKILAALGSSGICGIGLYQAISSHGTSFTKVN
jgi:hypothetical protein